MAQHNFNWSNIPLELQQRNQWVVAGVDKKPFCINPQGQLRMASPIDKSTWGSFQTVARYAWDNNLGIGYMLSQDDPFTCIDLDVKDATNCPDPTFWTTPQEYDRFWSIVQHMNSYTETSRSGKGLHIWVKGNIGQGCRRAGVEVYSQERYIICTGNKLTGYDKGIQDRQSMLDEMVKQMRVNASSNKYKLVEVEEDEPDEVVIDRAINAGNANKFNDLCMGRWEQYGFPSQSEADLALMSIFTFYSKSNEQCRRLFRMTALGKRDKAQRNNKYLDYTLTIIRSREERDDAVDASALIASANLKAQYGQSQNIGTVAPQPIEAPIYNTTRPTALHSENGVGDMVREKPTSVLATLAGPSNNPDISTEGLQWPPGMMGSIASFIFNSAPRPVAEVAIVAALGLIAGICGKAYSIPQSGLNIYVILVARSAIGKEAMHSGISALCKSALTRCPSIMDFVDFTEYASGPALIKKVVVSPSVVNVAGEWGRKLKAMSIDDKDTSGYATLRTAMTNLYQKSGPQSIVGGISYSNKDNNVASVSGVSFSMIGETTPGTLFDSLTDTMMEDGFLSRFTIVEYKGDRPPLNQNQILEPTKALGDAIGELAQHVKHLLGVGQNIPVGRTAEAAKLMFEYENKCDAKINGTDKENIRQMWNRASLKVMRISALLACIDNWVMPVITDEHVKWALHLVNRDIESMMHRIMSGDIGLSDMVREKKIMSVCTEYLSNENKSVVKLIDQGKLSAEMHSLGVIPRWYIVSKVGSLSSFIKHRGGIRLAVDSAIQSLIDSGYLRVFNETKSGTKIGFHGKAYSILKVMEDV